MLKNTLKTYIYVYLCYYLKISFYKKPSKLYYQRQNVIQIKRKKYVNNKFNENVIRRLIPT